MARLTNDNPISIDDGYKNVQMSITSGDVKLQYSTNGLPYVDVPDSTKTASTGFNVSLPTCDIKAIITGVAEVSVNKVGP